MLLRAPPTLLISATETAVIEAGSSSLSGSCNPKITSKDYLMVAVIYIYIYIDGTCRYDYRQNGYQFSDQDHVFPPDHIETQYDIAVELPNDHPLVGALEDDVC